MLIFYKNLCCGRSLESPRRCDSNEHPQHRFLCLVATESSMLTFIVLPHCGIKPQTLYLMPSPVTDTDLVTSASPTPKIRVQSKDLLVSFLTTFISRNPWSNPVAPNLGAHTLQTALLRPVWL